MTYFLTPEAAAELADAATFCAQWFSASIAEDFLKTFELKVRLIAELPAVGTETSKGRRLGGGLGDQRVVGLQAERLPQLG
ncbi:MAG: hypothetical protein MUF08_14570, partial [Burkholderiaceae bacterium]|nr:hypothetical protein [Burkholderiaceae bacterium]